MVKNERREESGRERVRERERERGRERVRGRGSERERGRIGKGVGLFKLDLWATLNILFPIFN